VGRPLVAAFRDAMKQKLCEFKARRRELGWRGALKPYGWRVVVAIVLFYLVRDIALYIVLPYLVVNNLICAG
jgi:hypothetical protein